MATRVVARPTGMTSGPRRLYIKVIKGPNQQATLQILEFTIPLDNTTRTVYYIFILGNGKCRFIIAEVGERFQPYRKRKRNEFEQY